MLDLDDPRPSRQSGFFRTTTIAPGFKSRCSFEARSIDDDPQLLEQSYRLRYQVYCVERKFLPAENYPDQREIDAFDRYSIHVGAVDSQDRLVGTGRVVRVNMVGLPLFRYCTIFPHETDLYRPC
ncbi:MAG: GNAT family N-acetyltransferase, partial [Acidobacteria bacterium]|nr:GNAT family N-acetyltransferase [Acidobacteriota bacterium]